ncbi:MAG: hypothetical protein P9L99_19525 [Candidatus Lernaella stagnicola]|nr:hypothetical protein [Candidatus Lernaella stagnicola]
MRSFFTFSLGIILLIWLPGYALSFWAEGAYLVANFGAYTWAIIGFAAYLPIHFVFVRRWYGLQTLEHELTHAIFAILFLRRVTRFVATARDGGVVYHQGSFGGEFGDLAIGLGPYVFPTFTVLVALLRPVFSVDYLPIVDGLIGFTLGFHTLTTISETIQGFATRQFIDVDGQPTESDIGRVGVVFAAIYIPFFTLFYHGIVLAQMRSGFAATWQFIRTGALLGWGHATALAALVHGLVMQLLN